MSVVLSARAVAFGLVVRVLNVAFIVCGVACAVASALCRAFFFFLKIALSVCGVERVVAYARVARLP